MYNRCASKCFMYLCVLLATCKMGTALELLNSITDLFQNVLIFTYLVCILFDFQLYFLFKFTCIILPRYYMNTQTQTQQTLWKLSQPGQANSSNVYQCKDNNCQVHSDSGYRESVVSSSIQHNCTYSEVAVHHYT